MKKKTVLQFFRLLTSTSSKDGDRYKVTHEKQGKKYKRIKRIQFKTGLRGYVTYIAAAAAKKNSKRKKHEQIKREIVNVYNKI